MGLAAGVSCWQGPMRSLWSSWSSWVHALVYSVLGKNTWPWASSRSPLLAKSPVPFGSKIVRQAPRFCHRTLISVFQPGAAQHLCKMFDQLTTQWTRMLKGIQNIKEKTRTDPTMLSAKNFPVNNSKQWTSQPHTSQVDYQTLLSIMVRLCWG